MGQIRDIYDRSEFPTLLDELGLHGTIVEVGVDRGAYSYEFVPNLRCQKVRQIVLVDTWSPERYFRPTTQEEMDGIYGEVVKKFDMPGVSILRTTSQDASKFFKGLSLDFVYIDGAHDYDNAYRDITEWWKAIKPNGILAGHDVNMAGVQQALTQFRKDNPWVVIRTVQSKADPSWWVVRQ
jgi:hypothetical protein